MKKCKVLLAALSIILACLSVCSCAAKDHFSRENSFVYLKQDSDGRYQIYYWDAVEKKKELLGQDSLESAVSADKTKVFFGQNMNEESVNSPYYNEMDLYFADVGAKIETNLVEKRVIDFAITPDGKYVLYVTHDEKLVLLNMETEEKEYLVSNESDMFMAYHLAENGSVIWGLTSLDGEEYDIKADVYVKAPGEKEILVAENSKEDIYFSEDHSVISGKRIDGTVYLYENGKGTSEQDSLKTEIVDDSGKKITLINCETEHSEEKEISEDGEVIYFMDKNDSLYYNMDGKEIKIDDDVMCFNYSPMSGVLGRGFYYDYYDVEW